MQLDSLTEYLDDYLRAGEYQDYAPNGLQVEGRREVRKIALGVTASLRFIEAARERGADAVLVHHGWFWKGEPAPIVGMKKRRVAALLGADMSLIAYHLPLDAHEEVGNNARLAAELGLKVVERRGEYGLVNICEPVSGPLEREFFIERVASVLKRRPLCVGAEPARLSRIALCSGGAQDFLGEAVRAGCDAYLSGEISERTTHEAREQGILYLSAGHHATERFGIQALGARLEEAFPGLECFYLEDENPV